MAVSAVTLRAVSASSPSFRDPKLSSSAILASSSAVSTAAAPTVSTAAAPTPPSASLSPLTSLSDLSFSVLTSSSSLTIALILARSSSFLALAAEASAAESPDALGSKSSSADSKSLDAVDTASSLSLWTSCSLSCKARFRLPTFVSEISASCFRNSSWACSFSTSSACFLSVSSLVSSKSLSWDLMATTPPSLRLAASSRFSAMSELSESSSILPSTSKASLPKSSDMDSTAASQVLTRETASSLSLRSLRCSSEASEGDTVVSAPTIAAAMKGFGGAESTALRLPGADRCCPRCAEDAVSAACSPGWPETAVW